MTRRSLLPVSLVVGALLTAYGCALAGDGVPPPATTSYFPVGLAVDPTDKWLYVVNSDFDLQYNQGTLQSLDMKRVAEVARRPCSADADCGTSPLGANQRCDTTTTEENVGSPSFLCVDVDGEWAGLPCGPFEENTPAARAVSPGRCGPIDLTAPADGLGTLQFDVVQISAFATNVLLARRPVDQGGVEVLSPTQSRLFLPVRGDSSLHFIDVEAGKLDCGQPEPGASCDERHRVMRSETADPDVTLSTPVEPFDIAATRDGRRLVMSHQTGGVASAFYNDWSVAEDGGPTPPTLVSIEGGMPTNAIGVAHVPRPALVDQPGDVPSYQDGFLVTFRNDASVHLLRFLDLSQVGAGGAPPDVDQPVLFDVARTRITTNTVGSDSRGIAIDDSKRRAAEQECAGDLPCLRTAATIPFVVYVANRAPNSLLVGRSDSQVAAVGTSDVPTFHDTIPLTQGPSRVVLGHVIDERGEPALRVFVICFDAALIYVFDPERRTMETEIYTGRGPHSLTFPSREGGSPLAFIGHFTDSYVGVISLDKRHPQTFGSTLAILGKPTPPRASR